MAVPFSASDTPKDRSEFSHPDMAILYTVLSYFSTGLAIKQFRDSVRLLQQQGPTARQMIFKEWIKGSKDGIDTTVLQKFDTILKVDLDNKAQISLMYKNLGKSMDVICYWMNHFVFPTET
jgi:hypothetical protein